MKTALFPENREIKAVIFDLDGTLYETGVLFTPLMLLKNIKYLKKLKAHRKVMQIARKKDFGSTEELKKFLFSETARISNSSEHSVQRWYENQFYLSFVSVLSKFFSPRPGTISLLKRLKEKKIVTAVFSDYGEIEKRLRAINIKKDAVDFIFSGEEKGAFKPQLRPLKELLCLMEKSPEETVFVGDRKDTDGVCAEGAGLRFIHITNQPEGGDESMLWEEFISIF
ncbi:MAG: HAD family hydrolase [bacterium]